MRNKILAMFALLLIIPLLTVNVMAQDSNSDSSSQKTEVVATVNEEEITRTELQKAAGTQQLIMQIAQTNQQFAQLLYSSEAGQELLEEFNKTKLEEVINNTLLQQAAADSDVELTEKEKNEMFNKQVAQIKQQNNLTDEQFESALSEQGIESMEQYKKMFLENENLKIQKFIQEKVLSNVEVSDEEAKEFYNNNSQRYKQGERVEASHILVESKEKADELYNKLQNGASFADLAKNNSIDNRSAENGGKLGFIEKGQFIEKFEKVAFNLEVGSISEPVETEYGYHIIKVSDKKEASTKSFEEVKSQIKDQLFSQKRQQAVNQYIQKLRDEAKIEKNI
ncbi:MAG TPA: peptidylprolyl isomerase [Halanaerobiales bacterium]|nr:peptidylprolyl isomerase [Halanaerobiales bacterium]